MKKAYPSLTAYLKATKQTQDDLAAALGIRQGQLSRYVRGETMPRPKMALKIAAHTGVPVSALIQARASAA